jgi:uncharacterized coiled-coil DUF342 family protein
MATATAKKPRIDTEAVSQLSALPERVGIVETKVESIKEQITDLKADVREMHDCLDQTRDLLADKLEKMQEEYRANSGRYFEHVDKLHAEDVATHAKMDTRIDELEKAKSKWTMYIMAALAFAAGTGWLNAVQFPHVLKFLGL